MLKHLSFDGNKTAYLIQGQEFMLNFHFTRCLFVLVYYNNAEYIDDKISDNPSLLTRILWRFTGVGVDEFFFRKLPYNRFYYNKFWNKISFMSPKGAFQSITNVYHPEITFITFGYGLKIHRVALKINFLNTIQPSLTLKETIFKKAPVVTINENRVVLNPIKFNKKQHNPTLNVLEMELNNKSELSYTNFK